MEDPARGIPPQVGTRIALSSIFLRRSPLARENYGPAGVRCLVAAVLLLASHPRAYSNDRPTNPRLIRAGSSSYRVLVIGGLHGDENSALAVGLALEKKLLAGAQAWTSRAEVLMVPEANPTGISAHIRTTFQGVDLNRNFPTADWSLGRFGSRYFGGFSAASEKETAFLVSLIRARRPSVIIALHSPLSCVNFDGPAQSLASDVSKRLRLPLRPNIGYATPGSLGAYAGIERRIPTLTIEFPPTLSSTETNHFAEELIRFLTSLRKR